MKVFLLFLVSLYLAVALVPVIPKFDEKIEGEYVVVFHQRVGDEKISSHMEMVKSLGAPVRRTYNINVGGNFEFRAYHAKLTPGQLAVLRTHTDELDFVEEDGEVRIAQGSTCSTENGATWGLARISSTNGGGSTFTYDPQGGNGVTSYIIDTGIRETHKDFQGRVTLGFSAFSGTATDCNGHGTHVAGTVGGNVYGVAKMTNLVAVKVLNCAGSGSNSGVIAGIDWAANDASGKKANGNLSLGGGKSTAMNAAVKAAVDSGVVMVVAAGNDDANACSYSPASEDSAITVGATTLGVGDVDTRSSFSNYGDCVDIMGPGSDITSDWYTSDSAIKTISGTSMASPHVAGIVSVLQSQNPSATVSQIKSILYGDVLSGKISMDCAGSSTCEKTPNSLAHLACNNQVVSK